MQVVPAFGNGIYGASATVTRQRRLNVYFENRQDGDKSQVACFGTPGLVLQFTLSTLVRGILGTQSALYAVTGSTFYSLSSAGATLYSTSIGTSVGNVVMAFSPTQLVLVDGVAGYIYQSGALSTISASGFPNGAKTVTFVSSYFVCEQPSSQKFWVSGVFDGSSWNALAFASASQYSDNIVAVDSLAGNLVLFSERHTEFWQNVGSTPQPFAPIIPATSEYGIEAIWSRAHIDNSIIFLAHNPQGTAQVCRVQGYGISVISTPDLDKIFASFSTVTDMVALAYVTNGHPMYQLTSPSADRSFLFDCSTGIWSETQTGLTSAYATRHIGQFSTQYAGSTLVSDYVNGNVYKYSDTAYTDNGTTILREIVTRHASNNFNVIGIDEVYLDVESGVGLASGQGVDPQVSLEVSKNNGRTFSTPRTASIGALGNYLVRAVWRRFGSARDFVFRYRMTDPVKFVITSAAVSIRGRQQ